MRNEVFSEIGFYTKERNTTGHLYVRTKKMPVLYPDVLFFCLYTARILNTKKVLFPSAVKIQKNLKLGQGWGKVFDGDEDAAFACPVTVTEYRQGPRYSISASLLARKSLHFRLGYLGFGFFTRKKLLSRCAEYAVYTTMYTIRNINREDETVLHYLWQAAERLGNLEFGPAFNRKNCVEAAKEIYRDITGDDLSQFAP